MGWWVHPDRCFGHSPGNPRCRQPQHTYSSFSKCCLDQGKKTTERCSRIGWRRTCCRNRCCTRRRSRSTNRRNPWSSGCDDRSVGLSAFLWHLGTVNDQKKMATCSSWRPWVATVNEDFFKPHPGLEEWKEASPSPPAPWRILALVQFVARSKHEKNRIAFPFTKTFATQATLLRKRERRRGKSREALTPPPPPHTPPPPLPPTYQLLGNFNLVHKGKFNMFFINAPLRDDETLTKTWHSWGRSRVSKNRVRNVLLSLTEKLHFSSDQ